MAKSKSTISLAMLPMEDVAAYLDIVKGFSKKAEKATDTDKVAGIDADTIAIAVDKDHRDTVQNALSLGGIPAASYLTTEGSEALLSDTYAVSTIISNELKEVRDELYQLKAELAKQGLIKQNHVYDGFYDAFRNGEIRYIDDEVAKVNGEHGANNSTVSVSSVDNISAGEYVAFMDASGNMHAYKVEDIVGTQLRLDRILGVTIPGDTGVYKYAGSYYNGEFIFGRDSGNYTSTEMIKAIVKDGKTRVVIKTLGDGSKGFATKLSYYASTYESFIREIEMSLAYTGNPGSIRASIWEVINEDDNERPVCEKLGESNSIYISSCSNTLNEVKFTFEEPIEILAGHTYLIALYAGGADANNTWKIGGYVDEYDVASGVQWFTDDTYDFNSETFKMIPGSTDAYLALSISKQVKADIVLNNTGLYSCQEDINGGFTRARVELKVNREGIFNVASGAGLSTNKGIALKLSGGESTNPFFRGDKVVVGNMSSTLDGDCSAKAIQMIDDMYTPMSADVYRVGYTVIAKCKKKATDVPVTYGEPVIVELPLVAVMTGKESNKEAISSDRLIFEAEIKKGTEKALEVFDNIEIQVFWKSGLQADNLNTNPQFAGRILDISVSTDKSYNKA